VTGGYDGRGVWVCESPAQAAGALETGVKLIAEERVEFDRELAVLVARSPSGQAAVYPVVQTVQRDGICREVLAPAPGLAQPLAVEAQRLGIAIAAELGVTRLLAGGVFQGRAPALAAPGAVMVNVLGGADPGLRSRLVHVMAADPGVKVHLYGKAVRPGRK